MTVSALESHPAVSVRRWSPRLGRLRQVFIGGVVALAMVAGAGIWLRLALEPMVDGYTIYD